MRPFPVTLSAAARAAYWRYVDLRELEPGDCWGWGGYVAPDGYARTIINGRNVGVHRVSYALHRGNPGRLCVLHHCDNRVCSNPDHLFLGTKGDNNRDRHKKGRTALGARHGMARLGPDQVREIRRRASAGEPLTALGLEYGVTKHCIWRIVHRKTWRTVA